MVCTDTISSHGALDLFDSLQSKTPTPTTCRIRFLRNDFCLYFHWNLLYLHHPWQTKQPSCREYRLLLLNSYHSYFQPGLFTETHTCTDLFKHSFRAKGFKCYPHTEKKKTSLVLSVRRYQPKQSFWLEGQIRFRYKNDCLRLTFLLHVACNDDDDY